MPNQEPDQPDDDQCPSANTFVVECTISIHPELGIVGLRVRRELVALNVPLGIEEAKELGSALVRAAETVERVRAGQAALRKAMKN